jgi:C4-dicarboxylate transporter
MFYAIAAVFAFIIALILDLAGISKGHINETTFVIIGLGFAAGALVTITPAWSTWRGRTRP